MPDKKTQEEVMPLPRLKHFLTLAESEEIPCAFGVAKDKKEIFLLIDKNSTPKKISALLKKDLHAVLDPTTLRLGKVAINAEDEPGTVNFTVKRTEASGTKQLMTKLVKMAGRQVAVFELGSDEGSEDEDEAQDGETDDEDEDDAEDGAPPISPAPKPPAYDHAALAHMLAQLIPAIPKLVAGNAELQKALTQRAAAAGAALKANDLATAAAAIELLRKAMAMVAHSHPQGTSPQPGPQPSELTPAAELLARFVSAKEGVDTGLSRLQSALRDSGDEDLIRIADLGMHGMTDGEGVGLMKALIELRGATPDRQEAMSKAAREAALAYKAAVFKHVLVDLVDDNPWGVEVGIQAKLGPALDAIAQAA
jgi:hypothetical protein